VKEISLTNRAFSALVDDEDYERLSAYAWRAHTSDGISDCAVITGQGAGKIIRMHRMIMDPVPSQEVDHIDGCYFNNQKTNLRLCTRAQNARNNHGRWGRSAYIGVSLDHRRNKWYAYINVNRKRIWIGYFDSEELAAKARDSKATELFGEFANLNFPQGR